MEPMKRSKVPMVVFDLSDVNYFGSVFLALLLRCHKLVKQRGGEIVEPLISTQWFVTIKPLADAAIAAVKAGQIRIVPERVEKVVARVRDLATAHGAQPELVERIYRGMIAAFIDLELTATRDEEAG